MIEKCDDFCFIATESNESQGYQSPIVKDFVLHYDYLSEKSQAVSKIKDADVVIIGASPNDVLELRIKTGKLTFLYSERLFKKGVWRRFIPRTRKAIYNRAIKYKNCNNFYVLCASAYLPYDLSLLGFTKDKFYKWGYFPETKKYSDLEKINNTKPVVSMLWAGRFIGWKHPEIPILIAKKLKTDGYRFELKMIGDGLCRGKIEKLIRKYGLSNNVKLLGSLSPDEVRKNMEQSDIYLFTSDRNEGWGAVLNESMNSACAVVANKAIGSVPFLIKDGENGLVYNGRITDLYNKVKFLFDNAEKRKEIGKNAYRLITDLWNSDMAAGRLIELADKLSEGEMSVDLYEQGPCSKADIIKG